MREAPLPRCTVTVVVDVVSVPRVLSVPAAQPAAAVVGAQRGWARTSFQVDRVFWLRNQLLRLWALSAAGWGHRSKLIKINFLF